jgi:hypothetical protein
VSQNQQGEFVWYSVGRTINLGQFESLRVDVGESRQTEDGLGEQIFLRLRKEVDARLNRIVAEVEKELGDDVGKNTKKGK